VFNIEQYRTFSKKLENKGGSSIRDVLVMCTVKFEDVISDKAGGFFGVTAVCCGGDTVHYF
jgi:hypothetical protein